MMLFVSIRFIASSNYYFTECVIICFNILLEPWYWKTNEDLF